MIDMDAVRMEVEAARGELVDAGNVKGILSLPARTRIWRAMLDPQDAERSYRCRTELKMACLRRVLPLWERAFPGDDRVQEMLNLTQGLIDASQDPDDAEMTSDEFLADVYDEIEDFDAVTQPAAFVANGAVNLVGSALDRSLDFDVVGDIQDDDELLPDSLETSYCCASAAAGALNWQPIEDTDVDARRAFWMWYLDEAIPTVLEAQ